MWRGLMLENSYGKYSSPIGYFKFVGHADKMNLLVINGNGQHALHMENWTSTTSTGIVSDSSRNITENPLLTNLTEWRMVMNLSTTPTESSSQLLTTLATVLDNSSLSLTENGSVTNEISHIVEGKQVKNLSSAEDLNSPGFQSNESLTQLALIIICILAAVVTVANIMILVASKFTSGGGRPTLVFVRSLCVADTLAGAFGIIKTIHTMYGNRWINCFLGESLLFSSIIASNFTLVAFTVDCCVKLSTLMADVEGQGIDKRTTISSMVFLWNAAFIVGFMPLMGWNKPELSGARTYTCSFFIYYNSYYLILVFSIFGACILGIVILHIRLLVAVNKIAHHSSLSEQSRQELNKTKKVILTTRIDLSSQIVCYLPALVYILLHCDICVRAGNPSANTYLLFFVPLILAKSLLTAIVHGTRTTQIWKVMSDFCLNCCARKLFRCKKRRTEEISDSSANQRPTATQTVSISTVSTTDTRLSMSEIAHSSNVNSTKNLLTATPVHGLHGTRMDWGHVNHAFSLASFDSTSTFGGRSPPIHAIPVLLVERNKPSVERKMHQVDRAPVGDDCT